VRLASHAELDAARQVGDPMADALVAGLGADVWIVNAALRHVHRNAEPLPEGVPPSVRRFFDEHAVVPGWVDRDAVARAQRWATRHLIGITVALFCGSLPTAYGAARGARVLAATGRMRGDALDRRVNETAQFVLHVVAEGALGPDGAGLRAIQKVRLLHAAVRSHLLDRGLGDGEVPINQEDMLGTLFTFSVVAVRSLRLLGVPVHDDEAEDYYQLWRAASAMLGIEEARLPVGWASACDLAERIAARQMQESEHGRALMASLLAGMERHVPGLGFAPRYLVRYLVGDRLADVLGVPDDGAFQAKLAAIRFLPRVRGGRLSALVGRLLPVVGRPLLESVVAVKLEGASPSFPMPSPAEIRAFPSGG